MSKPPLPATGGSYIRKDDGSLERSKAARPAKPSPKKAQPGKKAAPVKES